jgi:hypothetical protein
MSNAYRQQPIIFIPNSEIAQIVPRTNRTASLARQIDTASLA